VIKSRYKALSENFAKTNAMFEKLARESIKEKKKKKKITKDYNNLWWLYKFLKRKIKKIEGKNYHTSRSTGAGPGCSEIAGREIK
jgi:hypothetical protein